MFLSAVYGPNMSSEGSGLPGPSYTDTSGRFDTGNSCEGPSDGVILNCVRSRKRTSEVVCCPVCSCTLRGSELQAHLSLEMDKLTKLSSGATSKRKSAGTPNSSSSSCSTGMGEDLDVSGATGSEVYERVRRNRERRLRGASRRAVAPVPCPICGARLHTATADRHVENCLGRAENHQEDESVDVEGEEEPAERGFGCEYSWGEEERVRAGALHLREGGALPSGAMLVRRASTDTTLVVDGDEDDIVYGPSQYSPERIAPQRDYEEPELAAYEEAPTECKQTPQPNCQETGEEGKDMVVSALKARIRELEQCLAAKDYRTETKCLICMGPYSEPVVSIQCWHVHCETCWLESLRAKKTCPQCNAITTASHLRRVYI